MANKNRAGICLLILIVFVIFLIIACSINEQNRDRSSVFTTLDRTVIPVPIPATTPAIHPYEITKFSEYGYGVYRYGPGLSFDKRLDLMPAAYQNTSGANAARLLKFFAMTDVHITDEESPAGAVYFGVREKNGIISGYSPAMLYSTHMLDAAIRTVNALHKADRFDFGIFLGDVSNNAQYNELRWFIDVIDGNNVDPDSGVKDDPIPGPNNDFQDAFTAAGLDKTIPWYSVLGNHDHFWMGTNPPTDYIRQTYTGSDILQVGDIFTPGGINRKDFYVGVIDGTTPYGAPIGMGAVNSTSPLKIPADPKRRFLSDRKSTRLNSSH